MPITERPKRGTRPANRRDLIVDAATHLFATRGYENINMAHVAEAVAVRPSALYRHFSSKEDMLLETVMRVADDLATTFADQDDAALIASTLAQYSLDHRTAGAIWEREVRHLSPESYTQARRAMGAVRDQIHRLIRTAHGADRFHTDLASSAAVAVAQSIAFHGVSMSRPAFDHYLTSLIDDAFHAALTAPAGSNRAPRRGLARASRSSEILTGALRLFSEHTFASVTVDDIAASAGLVTSGLYNYYDSKVSLLSTALQRANGYLQMGLDDVLGDHDEPAAALHGLMEHYAGFSSRHPHLVHVLLTEIRNLPEHEKQHLVKAQREYVGEWTTLLEESRPELDHAAAAITVHAAIGVSNTLVRRPLLQSGAAPAVLHVMDAVLDVSSSGRARE